MMDDLNFVYPDGSHFRVEFLEPKFPTKHIETEVVIEKRGRDFSANKLLFQRDLRNIMRKKFPIRGTKIIGDVE